MKSGKQIGQAHLVTLEAYFAGGGALPVSANGTLNLAELARATGIPKSSFYQNPKVKERLEAARQAQGVGRQGERQAQPKAGSEEAPAAKPAGAMANPAAVLIERRLHRLEQQNAALVAENFELRRQVKELRLQLGREDMMIETGRRVAMPLGDA
jgi:hypothetical protein